jgi:hypothetical protein
MAADFSAYAVSMLQFLFGIAPVLVFLFVRLTLALLKSLAYRERRTTTDRTESSAAWPCGAA